MVVRHCLRPSFRLVDRLYQRFRHHPTSLGIHYRPTLAHDLLPTVGIHLCNDRPDHDSQLGGPTGTWVLATRATARRHGTSRPFAPHRKRG